MFHIFFHNLGGKVRDIFKGFDQPIMRSKINLVICKYQIAQEIRNSMKFYNYGKLFFVWNLILKKQIDFNTKKKCDIFFKSMLEKLFFLYCYFLIYWPVSVFVWDIEILHFKKNVWDDVRCHLNCFENVKEQIQNNFKNLFHFRRLKIGWKKSIIYIYIYIYICVCVWVCVYVCECVCVCVCVHIYI